MTNVQKLQAWVEEEKKNGLIDIKLFHRLSNDPKVDLETAAGSLLDFLTGPFEDITNQIL